jgi:hypothetical protein
MVPGSAIDKAYNDNDVALFWYNPKTSTIELVPQKQQEGKTRGFAPVEPTRFAFTRLP